jgi:hypothetical protein
MVQGKMRLHVRCSMQQADESFVDLSTRVFVSVCFSMLQGAGAVLLYRYGALSWIPITSCMCALLASLAS